MKPQYRILISLLVLLPFIAFSQEEKSVSDTTVVGRLIAIDSLERADSLRVDTLSDAERARETFQKRFEKNKKEQTAERIDPINLFDSLAVYYLSDRFNLRDDIDRSYYHGPADYVKSRSTFFVNQSQVTPMRNTIKPFGLGGGRLSLISGGQTIDPFEHLPEPDGLVDMDAMPAMLDDGVFALRGPLGILFGSDNVISSIVTTHTKTQGTEPFTNLSADKGSFGYSWVRGRYNGRFSDGRTVDAGIEYRKADGPIIGRGSNDFHYYGDFLFPLKSNTGLHTWGQLYDRSGQIVVRPEIGGKSVQRNNFDRQMKISLTHDNSNSPAHSVVGYTYAHHGSTLSSQFGVRYRITEHGMFLSRDWLAGHALFSLSAEGGNTEYDNGFTKYNRLASHVSFKLASLTDKLRFALVLGGKSAEGYGLLPQAMLTIANEHKNGYYSLSVGYSSRAPKLQELHLPSRQSSLYGISTSDYAESGNEELLSEKQLVSSITAQIGTAQNNVGLSVTGGRIRDGIDWYNSSNSVQTLFSPENDDIDFVSATIEPRFALGSRFTLVGGGSYHWIDQSVHERPAYSPEYQAFGGVELHVRWEQRLLDLFAYGEVVYVGPYDGYQEMGMGEYLVANAKLSFALKDYRMHFIFQNTLSEPYRSREYQTLPGRYFYYGFTWNFLN